MLKIFPISQQRCLFLFFCISTTLLPVRAEKIDADKAEKVALRYVQRQTHTRDVVHLKNVGSQRRRMNMESGVAVQDTVFYHVFNINDDSGFVIVSSDDVVSPVLGYSNEGNYDENNLAPAFAYWMDGLKQGIRAVMSQNLPQSEKVRSEWDSYLNGNISAASASIVGPLVTTRWDQGAPFYNMCPLLDGSRSITGCVATAMAQLMNYHRYPVHGSGWSVAYNLDNGIRVPSVNMNVNYDWENMLDSYSSGYNPTQATAVATLMYHCGVSVQMGYSPTSSGAYSHHVTEALYTYFGFDKSMQLMHRQNYGFGNDDATWEALLKEQLDAGLPVYYAGSNHAFVCDGYDDSGLFHFNWGWGGANNGWFITSANFDYTQVFIVNMKPDEGGVATYSMGFSNKFESSSPYAPSNETFTISTKIWNLGQALFPGGTLGIMLTDDDGEIIELTGSYIIPPLVGDDRKGSGNNYIDDLQIQCKVSNDVALGRYYLKAAIKPTGGEWEILTRAYNCPNSILFQVIERYGAVTGITLNKQEAAINAGATMQLVATVMPDHAYNKVVTWNSSDTEIATVNSRGIVTGLAAGTATITAITQDGGKQASCMITVNGIISGTEDNIKQPVLFPNPAKEELTVSFSQYGVYRVSIYATDCRALSTNIVTGTSCCIDVSSYPQGVYMLIAEDGKMGKTVSKFLIQH